MPIKLLAFDVDGVMTDGTVLYTENGEEMKAFSVQDGLGVKCLLNAGVEIVVISGRGSKPLERRLDDLGIRRRRLNCCDKTAALSDICDELAISLADCAFMGDDWVDMDVIQRVGYGMAPGNAVQEVKDIADWVSNKDGGRGAVREACEHIASGLGVKLVDVFTQKDTRDPR